MKWLDRIFNLEEINGGERCPTYLYRWTLIKAKEWGIYLHHFVGDDWSLDLHDHPKRFISVGLWGKYRETVPQLGAGIDQQASRVWRAPWVRSFPATHIHRLAMVDGGECWTLVVVLKPVREWGFWNSGHFIPWRKYVDSATADERKACP